MDLVRFATLLMLSASLPLTAADRAQSRSIVYSQDGIVSTSHVLASQAGAQILAKGGNAVDAAIAANAVLGVVEPMMCGIGGDFFMLYWEAKTGKLYGLNSSGWAPQGLSPAFLASKGITMMPKAGIHTITVPGAVEGWSKAHGRFGKLAWKELFPAAIRYASDGHPVHEVIHAVWSDARLKTTPEAARVFLPNGHAPAAGDIFKNPELGAALTLIAEQGRDAFYKGEIARKLLAGSRKLGGTMTEADLAEFAAEWVEPISTTYRGWRVYELPPNGQGMAALMMLNIMEILGHDWHTKIEAMKLSYADVMAYNADPRFAKVPVKGLLDKAYAAQRAKLIDPAKAQCNAVSGQPFGSDTTYLSVVDKDGNIASWIQSIYSGWGSGVVMEGLGFPLQNRGGGFVLDPKHPNVLAPRKRPFHTIIPAFMEKDDIHIGFGIMGGPNQPLAHAQFVSNLVDEGMNIQMALESPRFTKDGPSGCDVQIENRVPAATLQQLTGKGHKLAIRGAYSTNMGRGAVVLYNSKTKVKQAAADPRSDGAAIPGPAH
ncbi:gamma-glutamyltransferase [Paludibaculum fermentans]|uniref:Glutathione hydrolase proenzyme n=1 Tax=Paludibaculum fermentans TaxID=1473598 RepID=A0A7S7SMH0_PALFE|nr:gamma-glutamyltransferase [Paludibaculum fermentans]QOY89065.1 gamma-glutamyltransferase [Paludibaculum fermentans]